MTKKYVSGGIDELIDCSAAYDNVNSKFGEEYLRWCSLPFDTPDLSDLITYGMQVRENVEYLVVLGIGGSSLGLSMVANATLHLRHNELNRFARKAPKLYVVSNTDPDEMSNLFDVIDLRKTHFCVVTKSGDTGETLANFYVCYDKLKRVVGDDAKGKVCAVTTIGKGTLYDFAVREGIRIFGIDKGVGGRFSVLSNAGLVPMSILGIDIRNLLCGARRATCGCIQKNIYKNPALITASLLVLSKKKGYNICVLMPYSDRLRLLPDFFAQLWAESLGKRTTKSGATVNEGQTPLKALGSVDQHSLLQLLVEGPQDKVVIFVGVRDRLKGFAVSQSHDGYLNGKELGDILDASMRGTAMSLVNAGRPNMTITVDEINEESVGELLTFFMFATAYAGELLSVDAFNQPGVEYGKNMTRKLLGENMREVSDKNFIVRL